MTAAAAAQTFEDFVENLIAALDAEDLYALSHDLASLHPLNDVELATITDEEHIDSLLGGVVSEFAGSTFTPVMSRKFPIFIATGVKNPAALKDLDLVGPIGAFHQELFDALESKRRRTAFTPAAQLLSSLVPAQATTVGDLEVACVLQPAATVAGDAYDLAVTPAGHLAVLVMDSMGRGMDAALSTSLALATVRTVRRAGGSLPEQVAAGDAEISAYYGGDRFITMVAIEFRDDEIQVVNAGHEPIRHLSPDGEVVTLNLAADPPLGIDGLTDYRTHTLPPLEMHEALLILSDGAPEARGHDGKEFGEKGVNQALATKRGTTALQTADRLGRTILDFIPGELNDDLTTVVVQRGSR